MITTAQAAQVFGGIMFYELAYRWIATGKPADRPNQKAHHPWYGRDAAAAQRRRPGIFQLASFVACGFALGLTLSKSVGVGVFLSVAREVAVWYILPLVFWVRHDNEPSIANRMFPLEQYRVQNQIAGMLEHWDELPSLTASQLRIPVVGSPLNNSAKDYGLSGASKELEEIIAANATRCEYKIEEGDDLDVMLTESGVSLREVTELNMNAVVDGTVVWKPGNKVILPRKFCLYIIARGEKRQASAP